jgi:Tfp pilus assembly protein PilF
MRSMTCCSNHVSVPGRRSFAALVFLLVTLAATHAHAEPYLPASDAAVLATLPAGARSAVNQPQDLQSAILQAVNDIEQARLTGDPRYLGYVQAALGRWWNDAGAPLQVVLIRAQVHQHNHEFQAALAELERALELDPRSVQAHLTRSAIHQVQGNYTAAEADCRSLVLTAEPLITAECMSRVISLRGKARDGYRKLAMLRDRATDLEPRHLEEIDLTLADIAARLDDVQAAQGHYANALSASDPDAYTLLTYADFLLDQNAFQQVTQLFERHPAHQDLLLRAALAARLANKPESAALARRLREQYAAHQRRGDFAPSRDYARFLLDIENDANGALNAALTNWRSQREPADARIVVRAAIAAGKPEAAAAVIAFIRQNKLEDARLTALFASMSRGARP